MKVAWNEVTNHVGVTNESCSKQGKKSRGQFP